MTYEIMTIFAHPDDETFSTGGILAKHSKKGAKTVSVCLTYQEERIDEFEKATKILGSKGIMLSYNSLSWNNFNEIEKELIQLLIKFKPKAVITHIPYDYHQEHRLTHKIVLEAIEWAAHTTQFGESAHLVEKLFLAETTVLIPFPQVIVDISDVFEIKQQAINVYQSQLGKGGPGFYSKFQTKRAELRGVQAGVKYAEAYEIELIPLIGAFKPRKYFDYLPFD